MSAPLTAWQREMLMIEAIRHGAAVYRERTTEAEQIRQWRAEDAANGQPWDGEYLSPTKVVGA